MALAAVGAVLSLVGIVVWGGQYVASGSAGDSGTRKLLGAALALLLVTGAYALMITRPRGPLTSAGVAAGALGLPVLVAFLTLDLGGGDPLSFDAIALVSIAAWMLSYLVVPGARGHVFFLGASLFVGWAYLLTKIEPNLVNPFTTLAGVTGPSSGANGVFSGGGAPDYAGAAAFSFLVGLGGYLVAYRLDRARRSGPAVAFVITGFAATLSGISAAGAELPQAATAAIVVVLGVVLAVAGARTGRRFTTWYWTLAIAGGLVAIVGVIVDNNAAAGGIVLLVLGAVLVAATPVLHARLREPEETQRTAAHAAQSPEPAAG